MHLIKSLSLFSWLMALLLFATSAAAQRGTPAEVLHVVNRISYGPTPGELKRVARIGVDQYIEEQLRPEQLRIPQRLAERLDEIDTTMLTQDQIIERYRLAMRAAKKDDANSKQERREVLQTAAVESGEERLLRALQSPRQLEEVMVDFWFNHFNVYSGKGPVRVLVESYEREAIRPHAMGKFRALLGATARHPAMLYYLDNWLSVASPAPASGFSTAPASADGLNENYARQLMELHTLGSEDEFSQKDVNELARIFTGWTVNPSKGRGDSAFYFDASKHDTGTKTWLGHTVSDRGQAEGEWALDVLASSPATARHISYKLAQYFVVDKPSATLVELLSRRFQETNGDIRLVLRTLLHSPDFRDPKVYGAKFKTPYRYLLSSVRASAVPLINVRPLLTMAQQLGMPLYGCPTPDGYKNTEEAWLNPDAITRRVNFSVAFASGSLPLAQPTTSDAGSQKGSKRDKKMLRDGQYHPEWITPIVDFESLLSTVDGAISESTLKTIYQSEPRLRSAMVLGSPDFMRH